MDIINKYFPDLSEKQIEHFTQLNYLYKYWNSRINVISRKDIEQLYERHILHSLAIAKIIQFTNNTTVLDVGTGGGFPGIPLAIYFPQVKFTLIDSIGKKIKVVNEVINELKLTNVSAIQIRSNELKQGSDFVVSRAVTTFPEFVTLVQGNIRKLKCRKLNGGIIYLKGGDVDNEIKAYRDKCKVYNIANYFNEPFFETKKVVYLPL